MRAIISTAKRDGLTELARELKSHDIAIFLKSGRASALSEAGIEAEPVSALTRFPEILDGRVKTLHPAIFGGILARRDDITHTQELQDHEIIPIDIVVVNLYPFIDTISRPDSTMSEALEQIDIGGVSLIRAAAKNFQDVIVLVRPQDYAPVMQELREQGEVSFNTRRRLAATAFQHTASYYTAIAEYLRMQTSEPKYFPENLTLALERIQPLRYGENPHQQAAFYRWNGVPVTATHPTVADAEVLHGKELSFNNLLDLNAALAALTSFTPPPLGIIKSTKPLVLPRDSTLPRPFKKHHACGPI